MRFLMSPARRSIMRVSGVLTAVLLVASASSAFAFAARRPGSSLLTGAPPSVAGR